MTNAGKVLAGRGSRVAFWVAAGVFVAAMAGLAVLGFTQAIRVDRDSFLNGRGEHTLTRTHALLGPFVRLETWQQPTSFSYTLSFPFEAEDPAGRALTCQVALEGWVRTDSRYRNLADLSCLCEQPKLHHDRVIDCAALIR